jgi:hypothetical protein
MRVLESDCGVGEDIRIRLQRVMQMPESDYSEYAKATY